MNKFAITFRKTWKLFSKIKRSGLGEILEMHSAVFNDIDSNSSHVYILYIHLRHVFCYGH